MNDNQKKYNNLIKRYKKAEKFFNSINITEEIIKKYLPEFLNIIKGLSDLIKYFNCNGVEMTDNEVLEGFYNV